MSREKAKENVKRLFTGALCSLSWLSWHRRQQQVNQPTSCQDLQAEDPIHRAGEREQTQETQTRLDSNFWRDSGQEEKGLQPRGPPTSARAHISSQCISHCSEKEPQWETNHTKPNQKLTLIKAFLLELVERKSFAGPTDLQIRVTSRSEVSLQGAWDGYGMERKGEGELPPAPRVLDPPLDGLVTHRRHQ